MTAPRPETLNRLTDIVFDKVMTVLRTTGNELFNDYADRLDKELNQPLRLRATIPETSELVVESNRLMAGDGGTNTIPPIDDVLNNYPITTIDFSGGAIVGGTVTNEGNVFSLPTVTPGEFIRMVAVYQSANNAVDVLFSDAEAVSGDLDNPGSLFSSLDGLPIGYLDLESTGVSAFKTVPSVSGLIENPGISRFKAGGGIGGGALNDFKVKSVNGAVALIGKGFQKLTGDFVLVTGPKTGTASTDFPVDLSINLTTVLGSSPSADTTYWLYVDLEDVENPPFELTDDKTPVIRISDETEFSLFTTAPEDTNPLRYLPIGFIHTADDASWDGTEALFGTTPTLRQTLDNRFFPHVEENVDTVSSVSGSHIFTHGLEGEPQILEFFYFDGTNKIALDESSHLLDKNDETVTYQTLGLSFGSGEYVSLHAFYVLRPGANISLAQSQPEFGWYTDTSVSSVSHNLVDALDIKGMSLLEHDVSTDRYQNLPNGNLVKNYNDDTIFFDWIGLSPTPTLRYRLISGGRALPASVPIQLGGFTKFVGMGPGSFLTVTEALAASGPGESILVNKGYTIGAEETIDVDDIRIRFMPGIEIGVSGAPGVGWRITGDRVDIEGLAMSFEGSGTTADGVRFEGDDCSLHSAKIKTNNAGTTLTNAITLAATADRNFVSTSARAVLGTLSNGLNDLGSLNDGGVRGP